MHRQSSYTYPFPTGPTSPRYTSTHSTSSAQSASANPDEDWTKISDLAERRRIQNRIAQRNYRKKLKRRLEDLERRAGSSSASPEQSHAELVPAYQPQRQDDDAGKKRRTKNEALVAGRGRSPISYSGQASSAREDGSSMFSRQYTRQLSASPPPAFTYSYPMPDPPALHPAPYPQHAPYQSLPSPYSDYQGQSMYLPPLPTLPSMSGYDNAPMKPDNSFMDDEMINHFNMSYSSMGGMEIPTTQSYSDSNAYTPPLSLSHSFEHSRAGSPSEPSLMCPGTPISIPVSPHFIMG